MSALLLAAAGLGQTAPAQPAFEVASIKPAPPLTPELMRSGRLHLGVRIDKAIADFGGVSLTDLIARAYRVKSFQVSGPDWMNAARFDILAKLPEGASMDSVPEMLQALLADRFQLKLHRDSKEFPVYALIVGKGGAKLPPKPADYDSTARNKLRPMTMENYAGLLSTVVDRPVVDQTGLKGEYMVSMDVMVHALQSRVKAMAARQAAAMGGGGPTDAASDPSDSDTFRAVQALGLKLEPQKLPMPLLVIEHLEKTPTED
jgi:uncharacterized protein (TIGR03435 family)